MSGGCNNVSSARIGIGFVCVIGAGLATVLGALVCLFVRPTNELFLAAAVSFAAGVMLYVSFVDIYAGKSIGHFSDAGYSDAEAFTYATLCFFGGFPISWVLDVFSDWVLRRSDRRRQQQQRQLEGPHHDAESGAMTPGSDTAKLQHFLQPERSFKFMHMGLLTALAMALHNMPEGLVTFVSYVDSIESGITTAVAIAIHNFPEGVAIAASVYFGSTQRWKALSWAALSALSEPLGGLIGLAVVCGGSLTDTVFGILFGLVGGIMVYISLKELLPTAREVDPRDRVSTLSLGAGMLVMACSLIAIEFSG